MTKSIKVPSTADEQNSGPVLDRTLINRIGIVFGVPFVVCAFLSPLAQWLGWNGSLLNPGLFQFLSLFAIDSAFVFSWIYGAFFYQGSIMLLGYVVDRSRPVLFHAGYFVVLLAGLAAISFGLVAWRAKGIENLNRDPRNEAVRGQGP